MQASLQTCKSLGYEEQALVATPSGNTIGLLESIAFRLDGTIAIAVHGTSNANDKIVTLKLSNNTTHKATMQNGVVVFEGLYVNEFYGDMTISIENETYTYCLANYLNGLTNENAKCGVQALYNYAYHAEEYVKTLQSKQ